MIKDDLISRSALLKDIDFDREAAKVHPQEMCERFNRFCDYAEELVKKAHAVDAEPVRHGRWEEPYFYDPYDCYKCSCCGVKYDLTWNYCPNCGAKMDAEVSGDE